ncbi:Uncharacterised protein [uncultured archaeon]|nr:Uncharacterised protein [uncultured archaeon]
MLFFELVWIGLESLCSPGYFHAVVYVLDALYVHLEAEPVQKLRSELSFFWVHGSYQDEPGRVGDGYALAFDYVHAHGC